jgi:hypothetical protein
VPVWDTPRGATHEKAAEEWRHATNTILKEVLQ